MTIEEFIAARLDERETGANEAIGLERYAEPDANDIEYKWVRSTKSKTTGIVLGSMFVPGAPTPAEVLRQCAAARAILTAHRNAVSAQAQGSISRRQVAADGGFVEMSTYALQEVASIWSDHAEYQESWRPAEF